MPTLKIRYRDVKDLEDQAIPFILNSWLKSYQYTIKDKIKSDKDFFEENGPKIKRLIRHCRTVVAIFDEDNDKSDDEFYLGWICGIQKRLHYVYVKTAYRRDGIASALMDRVIGKTGEYSFPSKNYSFIRSIEERGFAFKELKERKENGERNEQRNT